MKSELASLPLAGLVAVAAPAPAAVPAALPDSAASNIDCGEDWYKVEKWGKIVVQPTWTGFGDFKGCLNRTEILSKRDDVPTKYDGVWDNLGGLCGETYCDPSKFTNWTAQDGSSLELSLDGNFPDSGLRDNFITLIHGAFNGTVNNTNIWNADVSTIDTFADFFHATSTYGDASGFWMSTKIQTQPADTPGCPSIVGTIGDLASLVPELGPIFGGIEAICGALS